MDLEHFDIVHRCLGLGLTPHELSNIEAGMIKRKVAENLEWIRFWGRIHGEVQDYLVVVAFSFSERYPKKKFYFSTVSSPELQQFPDCCDGNLNIIRALDRTYFKGDPSLILAEDVTELDRLARVVQDIDQAITLIPTGSFIVSSTRKMIPNPSFAGLKWEEAMKVHNFCHLCEQTNAIEKSLDWNGLVKIQNILKSAAEDLEATWNHTKDNTASVVTLQNLLYPGSLSFHRPRSIVYGSVYFGDGIKNADMAHML